MTIRLSAMLATILASGAACTSVEEFEGGTRNCPEGAAGSNLWLLVERHPTEEPEVYFGTINTRANDTWIVAPGDDVDETGTVLRFNATIDIGVEGVSALTLDVALDRVGASYVGTVDGENGFFCDATLDLID